MSSLGDTASAWLAPLASIFGSVVEFETNCGDYCFPRAIAKANALDSFPGAVLRSALGVTRHLDDLAPETRDLTKMGFVRAE